MPDLELDPDLNPDPQNVTDLQNWFQLLQIVTIDIKLYENGLVLTQKHCPQNTIPLAVTNYTSVGSQYKLHAILNTQTHYTNSHKF